MKKTIATLAAVAMLGTPALAEYTVKGSLSCGDAINEDADQHYREYNKWWLLGYFTARNYEAQTLVGQGIEPENIYQIALNFCKSNLGNDWDDAAIHTYDLLD
jgi:hypothetical protein